MCIELLTKCESESCSVVSDSLRPHGLYIPWNFPGQDTEVGSFSLLQGIFPSQGWNPCLVIAGVFFTRWAQNCLYSLIILLMFAVSVVIYSVWFLIIDNLCLFFCFSLSEATLIFQAFIWCWGNDDEHDIQSPQSHSVNKKSDNYNTVFDMV